MPPSKSRATTTIGITTSRAILPLLLSLPFDTSEVFSPAIPDEEDELDELDAEDEVEL
jgi:hypothetical protein